MKKTDKKADDVMKEKFKKIVLPAIIAVLMLTLAGCSNQPVEAPSDSQKDDAVVTTDNAVVDSDNALPADDLPDEPSEIILTAELYNDASLVPMGENPAIYYDGHYRYYSENGETGDIIKIGDGFAAHTELLPDRGFFAVLSDKEVLTADYSANQIYRVNIEDNSAQPLLPETEYGFTIEEYDAIAGKWENTTWFDVPVMNQSGSHFAYWSNKFAADGSPVYEPGIWLYDLKTGEQTRIASPDGEVIGVSPVDWIDDTHIVFIAGDTYYSYDIVAQTAVELANSTDLINTVSGRILVYDGEKGLTVHNAATGKKYIIDTEKPASGISRVIVWEDIAVFLANSEDDIYIVDMAKGTAKYIHAPFGELKPGIMGFTPDGKLVVDAFNIGTASEEGLYTVKLG